MKRKLSGIFTVVFAVFIDFLLILNLITGKIASSPVREEELNSVSDIIADAEYIDGGRYDARQIIITINSDKYVLYAYDYEREEFQELFNSLKKGASVDLTYKKVLYKYIFRNIIIDLDVNGKSLQTIEAYNSFYSSMDSYYSVLTVLLILGNLIGIACFLLFFSKKFQLFLDKHLSRITDEEAKRIIKKASGCENTADFEALDIEKKEKCIKRLSKKGISVKRISQLTGLSKKDIKRILKKE
ncbi:MAG: hypothetical protein E7535_09250 [Ruminococcaceae bacterium]|nr:hypothetical protein [Oscillospiraceae bacterium]